MELSLNHLSFGYSRRKPPVLNDVNAKFNTGGVCGLLGPNGAGKSTLLYIMSGLLLPTSGNAAFNGTSTALRRPDVLASIYLIPEEPSLPRMSLAEYVKLYSAFYPEFSADIMADALKEFEMPEVNRLDALSMGQRKKVILSFALACRTPVLLMDEPTNGLDIPGKAAFRRLIARYASDERLILISTHQVRDLDRILDHIIIMNHNQFVLNASVADLQGALHFGYGLREVPENAIAAIPSLYGFDTISPASDAFDETEINLEVLFDAALKHPQEILRLLDSKTPTSIEAV